MKINLLDVVGPPIEHVLGLTENNLIGLILLFIAVLVFSVILVNVFIVKKSADEHTKKDENEEVTYKENEYD